MNAAIRYIEVNEAALSAAADSGLKWSIDDDDDDDRITFSTPFAHQLMTAHRPQFLHFHSPSCNKLGDLWRKPREHTFNSPVRLLMMMSVINVLHMRD